jgi:hypothetical protein
MNKITYFNNINIDIAKLIPLIILGVLALSKSAQALVSYLSRLLPFQDHHGHGHGHGHEHGGHDIYSDDGTLTPEQLQSVADGESPILMGMSR